MKCLPHCRCGKHNQHPRVRYPQLVQSERMQMVTAERLARGTLWRGTPSAQFDWDAAIERLYAVFDQVYGPTWRGYR